MKSTREEATRPPTGTSVPVHGLAVHVRPCTIRSRSMAADPRLLTMRSGMLLERIRWLTEVDTLVRAPVVRRSAASRSQPTNGRQHPMNTMTCRARPVNRSNTSPRLLLGAQTHAPTLSPGRASLRPNPPLMAAALTSRLRAVPPRPTRRWRDGSPLREPEPVWEECLQERVTVDAAASAAR